MILNKAGRKVAVVKNKLASKISNSKVKGAFVSTGCWIEGRFGGFAKYLKQHKSDDNISWWKRSKENNKENNIN